MLPATQLDTCSKSAEGCFLVHCRGMGGGTCRPGDRHSLPPRAWTTLRVVHTAHRYDGDGHSFQKLGLDIAVYRSAHTTSDRRT
jgi:hypothetical protein